MNNTASSSQANKNPLLISVFVIFFMCGLIGCFNLVLMPMFKNLFSLNFKEIALVQLAFNITFLFFSYPAGLVLHKTGYQKTLNLGLWAFATGCLGIVLATQLSVYPLILLSFFILGIGFNFMMVAGNPFLMSIGSPETASSRVTLGQAMTSVGQTLAPLIGSYFIFKEDSTDLKEAAVNVQLLYVVFIVILLVLIFLNSKNKNPEERIANEETVEDSTVKPWHYRQLIFAFIGIFMYIGIEASIGSVFINFLQEPEIGNLTASVAGKYFAIFWMLFTVGRFIGVPLQKKVKPNVLLSINATLNILLILYIILSKGETIIYALLLVGFFNSIMFPAIFSLGLHGLGKLTAKASGIMFMALCGGAFIPFIHGAIVDKVGLQLSFILTLCCYVYILFFGTIGYKPKLLKQTT